MESKAVTKKMSWRPNYSSSLPSLPVATPRSSECITYLMYINNPSTTSSGDSRLLAKHEFHSSHTESVDSRGLRVTTSIYKKNEYLENIRLV